MHFSFPFPFSGKQENLTCKMASDYPLFINTVPKLFLWTNPLFPLMFEDVGWRKLRLLAKGTRLMKIKTIVETRLHLGLHMILDKSKLKVSPNMRCVWYWFCWNLHALLIQILNWYRGTPNWQLGWILGRCWLIESVNFYWFVDDCCSAHSLALGGDINGRAFFNGAHTHSYICWAIVVAWPKILGFLRARIKSFNRRYSCRILLVSGKFRGKCENK